MALWDLAGAAGRGTAGGAARRPRRRRRRPVQRRQSPPRPEAMAARARTFLDRGYRRLQVKLGDDPDRDAERLAAVRAEVGPGVPLFGDANGLYSVAQARRLLRAAAGVDFWLEQPCATYDECRALREHCPLPMVLDESIDGLPALLRAAHGPGRRRRHAEAGADRRHHAHRAAARRRGRARAPRHGGGHRRRRPRHRRRRAPVAVDAGRAPAAHRRLQRLGDGLERHRHARAGWRPA